MASSDSDTAPPEFVDTFEARHLGRSLKRHGLVIVLCALFGAAIGVGWSLMSPNLYRAEAVLQVNIQAVRIGADGIPLDVELVPPARRTVGTICQSDAVMMILSARLAEEPETAWPDEKQLQWMLTEEGQKQARTRPVRDLFGELYFDQLSQEMAALRAVDSDPEHAAHLANTWADICREMLIRAYGTTASEIQQGEKFAEAVRQELLKTQRRLAELDDSTDATQRLELTDRLDYLEKQLAKNNERLAELSVRLNDSNKIARIVSRAAPRAEPINASLGLVGSLFGLAGFLLGLAVALVRGPSTQ